MRGKKGWGLEAWGAEILNLRETMMLGSSGIAAIICGHKTKIFSYAQKMVLIERRDGKP